jgi:hypothetical protein
MSKQIFIRIIFSSEHYYKEEFGGEYEFYIVFSHSNEYYIFDFLFDEETISYYISNNYYDYYNKSSYKGFEYKPKKI